MDFKLTLPSCFTIGLAPQIVSLVEIVDLIIMPNVHINCFRPVGFLLDWILIMHYCVSVLYRPKKGKLISQNLDFVIYRMSIFIP